MFFHFHLTPLAEIKPWGKKDQAELHWFGLSDGHYWLQIGEIELFRYSKAFLTAYPPQDPALATHPLQPYVDYYVVRLWEDILEILPTILDPLPTPLLQHLEPIDKWLQWCQKVYKWREEARETCSEEISTARGDIQSAALDWWWSRLLYTGPIMPDPALHFWSDGQFIHCIWDSRSRLPTWEAVYGTAIIPLPTFMEAATSFNTHFISAMAERVHIVLADWSRPEIKLDLAQLAHEHVQRSEHFARRMAEIPTRAKTATEWQSILAAISAIEHDPSFLALP